MSVGTSRGLARYIAIKEITDNVSDPDVVTVTGDNHNFRHQYVFNPADLGTLNMNFGTFNQNAYVAFGGTKTQGLGDFNIVGTDTNVAPNAKSATLLFNADIQNADASLSGQPGFANFFYPAVNVTKLGTTLTEVAAMTWGFRGVPTQVSKAPWGPAFTVATNGFVRAKCLIATSRNPMTLQTIVSNGSTTTYALDFSPDSDGTGYTLYAFRYQLSTGAVTQITPSAVSPGNKTITLSSAYTSGDIIMVVYSSFDVVAS